MASSVFVVEALSAEGSVLAFGSGVAVAPDQVVTNRHVVAEGISLRIRQGSRTWPAIVTHLDADHDLCRLKAEGLNASPAGVRRSSSLQVGERVYAIGAPQGLELTLSEGLVSGLRDNEGVRIIQTTAPVSAGSSGGGLFDAQGRLVGITTFIVAEGQNLNFALPGDWVLALDKHAASAKPNIKTESPEFQALVWTALGASEQEAGRYEQAVQMYREGLRLKPDLDLAWQGLGDAYVYLGRYQEAVQAHREALRLTPNLRRAWFGLGIACFELGQYQEAVQAHREAIRLEPDLALAWSGLGKAYGGLGQYQQSVQALREAIRLEPSNKYTWYDLGVSYYGQGNRSKMMEVYQQLKALDPEMADEFFQKVVLP